MNHFSVVTVVKNDLEGLVSSRESLELQNYTNWIHIIIDGASNDETLKYLKTLPRKNTLFISEADTGIYNAMNKALTVANPESYIFYLNAGDVLADSNSLFIANQSLGTNEMTNWGCTTHEEVEQNGDGWVCKLVSPPSVENQLYAFGYRSHQGVVMKAKFIKRLGGFDEQYKIAADWDLIVRALKVETPKVWFHPLARFQLGGLSSLKILDAHMELRELRSRYLLQNVFDKIIDDLWCSIYLDFCGYTNYFTKILSLFNYLIKKLRPEKSKLYKELIHFGSSYSGSRFPVVYQTAEEIIKFSLKINTALIYHFRQQLNIYLHKKLKIAPFAGEK